VNLPNKNLFWHNLAKSDMWVYICVESPLFNSRVLVPHPTLIHFKKKLRMKKLNTYLHKPDVQGAIIISFIFLAIAVVTLVTWGK